MKSNHSKFFHSLFFHSSTNTLDKRAHLYIPVFALNKKHSQEIKPQIADLADFRFLDESPSGWLQEPCEALIRVIRMNPSNGLSISENPLNQLNPWLKNSVNIRSIRPIVPQELVYIKTYPFGMIKLIQQIYRIYSNPHTELCK